MNMPVTPERMEQLRKMSREELLIEYAECLKLASDEEDFHYFMIPPHMQEPDEEEIEWDEPELPKTEEN